MVSSELAILGGPRTVPVEHQRQWPDVTEEDRLAVLAVLDRGVFTGAGAIETEGLARDYADHIGVRHCLALNSGTAALHSCAVAAELQPGDEVIVPAFTYMASAMALMHHGAVPRFCDVLPDTFNLDPALIEPLVGERTRAIMVVHLHGMPADVDEIADIAHRHDLVVLEDVAQAHGATYRGRTVGTLGLCAGGSLNVTKNLPGGEGGLFVTDDDTAFRIARRLRYLGEDLPDPEPVEGRRYWSHGVGWNYRSQELPAAFARSQLRRMKVYNGQAQRNAARLRAGLSGLVGLVPPHQPDDRESIWYLFRLRLDAAAVGWEGEVTELRDRVVHALNAEGARAALWQHHPLPAHPVFRRRAAPWQPRNDREELEAWEPARYPEASRLCDDSFVLCAFPTPLAVQTEAVIDAYVQAVQKVWDRLDDVLEMPFETPQGTREAAALAAVAEARVASEAGGSPAWS